MSAAIHDLSILLRLRLTLLTRGAARGRSGRSGRSGLIRWGVLGLLMLLIAVGLAGLLSGIASGPFGRALVGPILVWASSSVTLLLFLYAVPAVLAACTYRSDLRLLLLTPLSPRLIVGEKFLLLYGGLTLPLLVVGGPVLIGVGSAAGLGLGYDVLAVLVLLLLPVAPLALAMGLTVVVLRWVPPAWGRNVAAFLGAATSIAYYIGWQVYAGRGAARPVQLRSSFAQVPHAWWSNLPSAWPGQALAALAPGQGAAPWSYLAAALVLAAALAVLAVTLAAYLFASGWATYQEVGRRKGRTPAMAPAVVDRDLPVGAPPKALAIPVRAVGAGGVEMASVGSVEMAGAIAAALAPPDVAAPAGGVSRRVIWWPLVLKEWRVLRRDPRQWARLLYPMVILVFAFYRNVTQSLGTAAPGTVSLFSVGWVFGTLAFLSYILCSSLALPIVNREARALYLLALAPLSARDVVAAKWTACVLPVVILVEVVVAAAAFVLPLAPWEAVVGGLAMGGLGVALSGAALLASLVWPRLNWDNPSRQSSTTAGLVVSLAGLLLAAVTCALLILTFLWAPGQPLAALASGIGLCLLLGTVIAVVALAAPRRLNALLIGA